MNYDDINRKASAVIFALDDETFGKEGYIPNSTLYLALQQHDPSLTLSDYSLVLRILHAGKVLNVAPETIRPGERLKEMRQQLLQFLGKPAPDNAQQDGTSRHKV